jgi:hypothetical protein
VLTSEGLLKARSVLRSGGVSRSVLTRRLAKPGAVLRSEAWRSRA